MLVGVTREFLESIEKNVIYQRPAWRVDNALVDMHRDSVLLMSDHSLFTHGIEMPLRTCCVQRIIVTLCACGILEYVVAVVAIFLSVNNL